MDENTTPPVVPAPPFSAPGPPEEPAPRKRPAKKAAPARKATAPAGPPAKRPPAKKSPATGSVPVVQEPPETGSVPAAKKAAAAKKSPATGSVPATKKSPATGSVPAVKKAAKKAPATGSVPAAKKAAAKRSPATGSVPVAKKAAPAEVPPAKVAPPPPVADGPVAFELPQPAPVEAPAPAPEPPVESPVVTETAAEVAEDVAASAASPVVEPPAPAPAPEPAGSESPAAARPAVPEPAAASAEEVRKAWHDNRLAQVLYHDWESQTYDDKWSISFDDRCIRYARDRFSALLGPEILRTEAWPYPKALEIGAGTGFFALNLKQAGVLGDVTVSDVSAGMVEAAQENARKLGFHVQGAVAGAESLPFEDDTFDVVVGHAVLHHIPEVEAALREVLRVLKPGGRFVIAGEPTRVGDWYARRLGRVTWRATTRITALPRFRERWAKSEEELDASSRAAALESVVDLHTFVPAALAETAERAGAVEVHTQTEEFLAALLGWPVRTFESAVNPDRLGWGWAMFAYRSWLRLSAVDRALSRVLPDHVFYNVGVTGVKPVR